MTDPLTALLVVGTAVGVFGSVQSSKAQKKAGKADRELSQAQKAAALERAKEFDRQAEFEAGVTLSEEADLRRFVQRLIGGQVAGFTSGAGVRLEGTPEDVIRDTLAEAELEAMKIRAGGAEVVRGLQVRAEQERKFGDIATISGRAAESAARAQARATLLGGISTFALGTARVVSAVKAGGG